MTYKTAYLWGPVSSFSGQLAAFLVQKGWHVHIATKGAFHVALSPLDLKSTAQDSLERALGGRAQFKIFEERVKFLDVNEVKSGTKYDAFVFCGLPPNFDEQRVSRAPWAAENFAQIAKKFKGTPVFIVSSLWSAIQNDGVVPEEIECERRKPLTQFEAVCQQYENRLLKTLGTDEAQWYLVRLPMMSGSTTDGHMINVTGPASLFERLGATFEGKDKSKSLILSYNPDATVWFLPVDVAVKIFWRLLEDEQRPRITNLVSTQSTLNQEWLQHLAKALGYKKATSADTDSHNLTAFLRRTLNDNILVKTRGLFEVMGRYQQVPIALDDAYFNRVIGYAKEQNWGKVQAPQPVAKNGKHEPTFDGSVATSYFTEFLPSNLDDKVLKELGSGHTTIGFKVDEVEGLDWVLKTENGTAIVESADVQETHPKVRFSFTAKGIDRLLHRKVSLERAIVSRDAKVEGNPLEILRACNFLKRFMREHPYSTADSTQELQNTGAKS